MLHWNGRECWEFIRRSQELNCLMETNANWCEKNMCEVVGRRLLFAEQVLLLLFCECEHRCATAAVVSIILFFEWWHVVWFFFFCDANSFLPTWKLLSCHGLYCINNVQCQPMSIRFSQKWLKSYSKRICLQRKMLNVDFSGAFARHLPTVMNFLDAIIAASKVFAAVIHAVLFCCTNTNLFARVILNMVKIRKWTYGHMCNGMNEWL